MGRKRTISTGRKDSKGRIIKVARLLSEIAASLHATDRAPSVQATIVKQRADNPFHNLSDEDLDAALVDAHTELDALNMSIGQKKQNLETKREAFNKLKETGGRIEYLAESIYQEECEKYAAITQRRNIREESSFVAMERGERFLQTIPNMNLGDLNIELRPPKEGHGIRLWGRDMTKLLGSKRTRDAWVRKVAENTRDDFSEDTKREFSISERWRGEILRRVQEEHGLQIINNPRKGPLYSKENPFFGMRISGFTTLDGTTHNGIVVTKTRLEDNHGAFWQSASGGEYPSVTVECPFNDQVEALSTAKTLGLQQATVAYVVNDKTVVTHTFSVDDPLEQVKGKTITEIQDIVNDAAQDIVAERARITSERAEAKARGEDWKPKRRQTNYRILMDKPQQIDTHVHNLMAFTGMDRGEAVAHIQRIGGIDSQEGRRKALRELYGRYDPRKLGKDIVVLDFETTGLSPQLGAQVIQTGMYITDKRGDVRTKNTFHGIDHRDLECNGTGLESLHGVSPQHLKSQRRFRESVTATFLREKIQKGALFVAHNKDMELKFANAAGVEIPPGQMLDTMYLSRFVDPLRDGNRDAPNDNLDDFTNRYGVVIENHHDASSDVKATMDVLHAFLDRRATRQG